MYEPKEKRQQVAIAEEGYSYVYDYAQFDPAEPSDLAQSIDRDVYQFLHDWKGTPEDRLRILGITAPKVQLVKTVEGTADYTHSKDQKPRSRESLVESGAFGDGTDEQQLQQIIESLIPATLKDALAARLDRLGKARNVAQLGATR